MATSVASYMQNTFSLSGTLDDIINDYSMVEVCESANYRKTCIVQAPASAASIIEL